MATNRYFVASDYDLTLRLQELFHETVALQVRLDNAGNKEERMAVGLKIKETHHEITLLVKEMKHLLSDTEIVRSPAPLTFGLSKRGY